MIQGFAKCINLKKKDKENEAQYHFRYGTTAGNELVVYCLIISL